MTFENLHNGLDKECNCIEKAQLSLKNIFMRRLTEEEYKIGNLNLENYDPIKKKKSRNFRKNGCDIECQKRGISINIYNEKHIKEIKAIYTEAFNRSLQILNNRVALSPYFLKFKIRQNAGLVQETKTTNNPTHCTFYMSDDCTNDLLEVLDIESYTE